MVSPKEVALCDGLNAPVDAGRGGYNAPVDEAGRGGYNAPLDEAGRGGYDGRKL